MKPRFFLLLGVALVILAIAFFNPQQKKNEKTPVTSVDPDTTLVHSLLSEKLSDRTFSFATIADATSGKKVIPLDTANPAHQRIISALTDSLSSILPKLSAPDSPVRLIKRINEASRFFEDALIQSLDATPGITCGTPPTRSGTHQRSGYPDLRITDDATGIVFYLDPKLIARDTEAGTLRTFYFEPKDETLKITDDAVHLLVGITHDDQPGEWTFTGWRLVDLSTLRVRLKAEFQASNADLYHETELSLPQPRR